MYFNTENVTGRELRHNKAKAMTQEILIMGYFECHPEACLTPFEVHDLLFDEFVPITSVRRAMSELTKDKKLVKTDEQRRSKYNHLCFCWRLV